jgi:hypothetical protein
LVSGSRITTCDFLVMLESTLYLLLLWNMLIFLAAQHRKRIILNL